MTIQNTISIVTTNITFEPLTQDLPQEIQLIKEEIFELIEEAPEKALENIEKLISKYPDLPILSNWKEVTYKILDYDDKKLIIENYEKFPNYLYAKCSYANLLLEEDKWQQIPEIFENKFLLNRIYPDRDIFYAGEVVAFTLTIGIYYCYANNFQQAKIHLDLIGQINEELPEYQQLLLIICKHFPDKIFDIFAEPKMNREMRRQKQKRRRSK